MFVRVRVKGGPLHEFDVPVPDYEFRGDRYVLVDGDPVSVSRPPTYKTAVEPKKSSAAKKRAARKPAEETETDAPTGA